MIGANVLGVHPTIAGVIAAMTIPARTRLMGREFLEKGKALLKLFEEVVSQDQRSLTNTERHRVAGRMKTAVAHVGRPLQQLEYALHPWVTIVVMPVSALANAGVTLDAGIVAMLVNPVALGVALAETHSEEQGGLSNDLNASPRSNIVERYGVGAG